MNLEPKTLKSILVLALAVLNTVLASTALGATDDNDQNENRDALIPPKPTSLAPLANKTAEKALCEQALSLIDTVRPPRSSKTTPLHPRRLSGASGEYRTLVSNVGASLSAPLIPTEYRATMQALLIQGTLLNQPYRHFVDEQDYLKPYPELPVKERLLRIFSDYNVNVILGDELTDRVNGTDVPKGGNNRVFWGTFTTNTNEQISVVVKIMDPQLIARHSGLTEEQVDDNFMAALIQLHTIVDGALSTAVERYHDSRTHTSQLTVSVLKSLAINQLRAMGITIQPVATGVPLRGAESLFIDYGLETELLELAEIEALIENEITTLLQPYMDSRHIRFSRSIMVKDRISGLEHATQTVVDMRGRQNANVLFSANADDSVSAHVSIYDK